MFTRSMWNLSDVPMFSNGSPVGHQHQLHGFILVLSNRLWYRLGKPLSPMGFLFRFVTFHIPVVNLLWKWLVWANFIVINLKTLKLQGGSFHLHFNLPRFGVQKKCLGYKLVYPPINDRMLYHLNMAVDNGPCIDCIDDCRIKHLVMTFTVRPGKIHPF